MTRKAARNQQAHGADITSSPNVSRRSGVLTAGALIASAAFSGMGATPAAASELNDPRLNVIGQALAPRLRDYIDLGRQHPGQQPAAAAQAKTFDLNIADGPLGEVAAALARATGASVQLSIDSIAPIHSPGVSGNVDPRTGVDRHARRHQRGRAPVLTQRCRSQPAVAQRVGQRHRPRAPRSSSRRDTRRRCATFRRRSK